MLKKIIFGIVKTVCYTMIVIFAAFQFALMVSKNKDITILKYKKYYALLLAWIGILENGNSLCTYMEKSGFNSVAVYGGRNAGAHFVKQLQGSEVTVKYIIDKAALPENVAPLPVYHPQDELPVVDAVIVVPIWDYQRIKKELGKKVICPVISLEEVIAGVENE